MWSLTPKGRNTHLSPGEIVQLVREVRRLYRKRDTADVAPSDGTDEISDETQAYPPINYRDALLQLLRELPPAGFERLCQRLLRESGFQQAEVTGRAGDGGLDGHGILQINPFASFRVLFQCKRYAGAVRPKEVRDFRGTMVGRADKGIILTTGTFTSDARKEAGQDGAPPIELVDSEKLLTMFEDLELGLKPKKIFDIDDSFFEEFH